jgi:hypothetical protein
MKNWVVGGLAVACAGVAVSLWLAQKETPQPAGQPEPPPVAAAAPAAPPAPPVVLADVVEVADLDPLLDPRTPGAGGEPVDPDAPAAVPVSTPVAPDRIPPAVD